MALVRILLAETARGGAAVDRVDDVESASVEGGVLHLKKENGNIQMYNSQAWLTASVQTYEQES